MMIVAAYHDMAKNFPNTATITGGGICNFAVPKKNNDDTTKR